MSLWIFLTKKNARDFRIQPSSWARFPPHSRVRSPKQRLVIEPNQQDPIEIIWKWVKNTCFKREIMQVYMRRANTSQQDVPPLSLSLLFTKSSPYHKRSSWPDVTVRGLENTDKTSSAESELYPGILDHLCWNSQLCPMNWLDGRRTSLEEVVMATLMRSLKLLWAPQPQ